jgi:hypothetical protein
VGTVEGYLVFLVMLAYFAFPVLCPRPPLLITLAAGLGLSGVGLLLSVWGIQVGHGGGRIAAWFSLVILLYLTVTFLLVSLNHGGAF